MKPAPFCLETPRSLGECVEFLTEHGDEAKILAGGQSLVPLMNLRLAQPSVLLDIGGLEALDFVEENEQSLRIGAVTRLRDLERDANVAKSQPLLAEALPYIGHIQIRNRTTVGGSIAHADPAAELPAVLLACGGTIKSVGPNGEREILASNFFQSYFSTNLEEDEVISEIELPQWKPACGWSIQEVSRRHGDFSLIGIACRVSCNEEGVVTEAAAAFFGVGETPSLAESTSSLVGTRADDEALRQVAEATTAELDPPTDIHVSADYRKQVGGVLARRSLSIAYQRATGSIT
jgi:CO/xanthine dehydrogenase FAD-binding subunit